MERYKNLNGNSNILYYEVFGGSISVIFRGGMMYLYTINSVGASAFEKMLGLAAQGYGLCSFIQRHVRELYVSKVQTNIRG